MESLVEVSLPIVRKRDKSTQNFQREKVIKAISAAWLEIKGAVDDIAVERVAQLVCRALPDGAVDVETIQDAVELCLMKAGHYDVAKAYIVYREQRKELRNTASYFSAAAMPDLMRPRVVYSPFEYPKAFEYWEKQQQSHWLHTEISLASDINDWKIVLTEAERAVVGHILKGFTQSEVFIQEYWTNQVSKWFKKPEIQMMAATFGAFESIHSVAYAYLNQSLGLDDFEAFIHEATAKAKIDRLMSTRGATIREMARALAIFSAFNEGVNLFSSFAILLNFSRFNKMKGLGQIIAFSVKDESLHSEAGCWLFRTLVDEHPEIFDDRLKTELYDAARLTITLEDAFIEQAFRVGTIEGLTVADMKAFIRHRANTKLQDLGLEKLWTDVSREAIERMEWFDVLSAGTNHADFFASRVTDYARGVVDFSKVWED